MNEKPHSWLAIERLALTAALKELARLPKPPKKVRKLILLFEQGELIMGTGVATVRVSASGKWQVPAVLPYQVIDVLASLVRSADPDELFRIEGVGESLHIGPARIPCSFQNPQINVLAVETAERKRQRVDEIPPQVHPARDPDLERALVLTQLQELYPDSRTVAPYEHVLVTIPELPNVLIRLTSGAVEFRLVDDPGLAIDLRFRHSRVWKKLAYGVVRALGFPALMASFAQVAAAATTNVITQEHP